MQTTAIRIQKILTSQFQIIWYALAFTIPLVFSSPQIVTGTIINCLLYLAALRMTKKDILPLVVLPSIGAVAHGILFGPHTIFLYYFLPIIWIGNYILVFLFLRLESYPYSIRVIAASIVKYVILQTCAQVYFRSSVVPFVFVSSMGYIQLLTSLLGGALGYAISYARNDYTHRTP